MELNIMKDELDRVAKKRKLLTSRSQEVIKQVVHEIEQAIGKLQSTQDPVSPMDQESILTDLKSKLNDICPKGQSKLNDKDIHVALSKYSKLLDKTFAQDISRSYRNVDFDYHLVNQIIGNHFYRLGQFDLGDCLINEAGEDGTILLRSEFFTMHQILEALKVKNLEPAFKWVSASADELADFFPFIQLDLHKLQYVDILQKGRHLEALSYARTHLVRFASLYMKEFQKLIASLLWSGRLEKSPYPELVSPDQWEKVAEDLSRLYCVLIMRHPYNSPLSVTVSAGVEGLPTLLKLANVIASNKLEWEAMKQLPIPIDLGKEFHFHSIFICPVSKEQSSEQNPPVLMPCGHVLCHQSILSIIDNTMPPLKCPYCPFISASLKCIRVFF